MASGVFELLIRCERSEFFSLLSYMQYFFNGEALISNKQAYLFSNLFFYFKEASLYLSKK